jgi:hypothetical protein
LDKDFYLGALSSFDSDFTPSLIIKVKITNSYIGLIIIVCET